MQKSGDVNMCELANSFLIKKGIGHPLQQYSFY
jgi:hypothetical protein